MYYYPPALGADLSNGFDKRIERDETINEHLDGLLLSLCEYERQHGFQRTFVDILTWRGILTRFLCTPFDRCTAWAVNIVRFQNTIFIEDHLETISLPTEQEARMRFWGYKFETLSTLPDTWDNCSRDQIEHRNDIIVNNHIQYCSVVRTSLDKTTLVMGGEVDCAWDAKPDPPENPVPHYVELKTSRSLTTHSARKTFELHKLLKFWAQSFLLGVPRIIVGFRTDDGYLESIEEYKTQTIPSKTSSFNGNLALAWMSQLFYFLKEKIPDQEGVWRLCYTQNADIVQLYKIESKGYGFLHPQFISWRKINIQKFNDPSV
ncbi:hypothetical protein PNEG_02900 [Pneumocystis murina B123]|uniref:Decapping nuclease n=1 Tax=Pneumocystis murina (strain B123) TaxID=1069680 RepID=M7NJD4_PNEMU|nr:hypothetical protein PNEG_02900 [Pneumocystis murina B123]EMR08723.1 hypothetical protein PNEG_02900 [Pneumocystis murina B123]